MLPVSGAEQLQASGAILTPTNLEVQCRLGTQMIEPKLTPAHNLGHNGILKVRERHADIRVCEQQGQRV